MKPKESKDDKYFKQLWEQADVEYRRCQRCQLPDCNPRRVGCLLREKDRRKSSRGPAVPVLQMNRDGTVVRKWSGAPEASQALDVSVAGIYRAISGGGLCRGFRWKYEEGKHG